MSQQPVQIFKYHGTGNDFIVVDAEQFDYDPPQLAPYICDRHRGVGGDGLILVDRDIAGFDARMTIYNRDGSRPQMCGNGIRCVARHLVERHGLSASLIVQTDAGDRRCEVQPDRGFEVDVDMGVPQIGAELDWRGRTLLPVDMGNPHAVVFETADVNVVDEIGAQLNAVGSPFADGVNVEFTAVRGDIVDVSVYERGVGRTQACGTGACAAAAAAWTSGRTDADVLEVRLPGGPLWIRRQAGHVWMRGDAEFVMEGRLGATWLRARS